MWRIRMAKQGCGTTACSPARRQRWLKQLWQRSALSGWGGLAPWKEHLRGPRYLLAPLPMLTEEIHWESFTFNSPPLQFIRRTSAERIFSSAAALPTTQAAFNLLLCCAPGLKPAPVSAKHQIAPEHMSCMQAERTEHSHRSFAKRSSPAPGQKVQQLKAAPPQPLAVPSKRPLACEGHMGIRASPCDILKQYGGAAAAEVEPCCIQMGHHAFMLIASDAERTQQAELL